MRFLLLALALGLTSTASAQLRFTPTPVEQRLDEAETRLDKLETLTLQLAESNKQIIALLATQQVRQPQPQLASYQPQQPQQPVVQPLPQRTTTAAPVSNLAALVRSHFPNGWRGEYADVSPRSSVYIHLQQHGYSASQIQGLDQNTALGLHALTHAGLASPQRNYIHPQENRVRTVPQQQFVRQFIGGCANGQCARRIFR